jgi:hypothetical protein
MIEQLNVRLHMQMFKTSSQMLIAADRTNWDAGLLLEFIKP